MALHGGNYIAYIINGADITRTCFKRGHPHHFVRYPVRADDGQFGKVAVQAFHLSQSPILNVEDNDFWKLLRNCIPHFVAGPG